MQVAKDLSTKQGIAISAAFDRYCQLDSLDIADAQFCYNTATLSTTIHRLLDLGADASRVCKKVHSINPDFCRATDSSGTASSSRSSFSRAESGEADRRDMVRGGGGVPTAKSTSAIGAISKVDTGAIENCDGVCDNKATCEGCANNALGESAHSNILNESDAVSTGVGGGIGGAAEASVDTLPLDRRKRGVIYI